MPDGKTARKVPPNLWDSGFKRTGRGAGVTITTFSTVTIFSTTTRFSTSTSTSFTTSFSTSTTIVFPGTWTSFTTSLITSTGFSISTVLTTSFSTSTNFSTGTSLTTSWVTILSTGTSLITSSVQARSVNIDKIATKTNQRETLKGFASISLRQSLLSTNISFRQYFGARFLPLFWGTCQRFRQAWALESRYEIRRNNRPTRNANRGYRKAYGKLTAT